VAIDVGTARIGVAVSDFHAILASGLVTIKRTTDPEATIDLITAAIAETEPIEIYVGLPIALSGSETASTKDALELARLLSKRMNVPVRMIDERMTTVTAASALRSSNRDSKSGRAVIDQIAATVILEQALSIERNQAGSPGVSVSDFDD
jgi:putative Holliday junction resolvase